ncbi:MAG: acyl-CoA dehydrogenase family protein [Actinomycetota bacterium]
MSRNPEADLAIDALLDRSHPIKADVAQWARTALAPSDLVGADADCVFDREGWTAVARRGVLGALVPEVNGGGQCDTVTAALMLEGIGLGCRDNGLVYGIASQMLSFQEAVLHFGTDAQRAEILEPACRGDLIGAFAITEPEAGSDSYALTTTATREGDDWVLHGHKAHITLAPVADVAVVFAKTDPSAGTWGISAFLVHTDRTGVTCTETKPKMGLRTTPFGDIILDGYVAPAADMLGAEGVGASMFSTCMESERSLIMASHLGAVERLVREAFDRANSRTQFGQPIGSFQAVSHRLVDMEMRLEAARLQVYKAAIALGRGRSPLPAAMAKLSASEAIASIGLDAARIHGARGYVVEYEVEREVRDALGSLVYAGTSDVQKNTIAALLGVAPTR